MNEIKGGMNVVKAGEWIELKRANKLIKVGLAWDFFVFIIIFCFYIMVLKNRFISYKLLSLCKYTSYYLKCCISLQ